jgi:hypothetical protein
MPDQNIWKSAVTVFIRMVGCIVMRSIDYLHDNSPMVAVVRGCFFDFQILNRRHSDDKRRFADNSSFVLVF